MSPVVPPQAVWCWYKRRGHIIKSKYACCASRKMIFTVIFLPCVLNAWPQLNPLSTFILPVELQWPYRNEVVEIAANRDRHFLIESRDIYCIEASLKQTLRKESIQRFVRLWFVNNTAYNRQVKRRLWQVGHTAHRINTDRLFVMMTCGPKLHKRRRGRREMPLKYYQKMLSFMKGIHTSWGWISFQQSLSRVLTVMDIWRYFNIELSYILEA